VFILIYYFLIPNDSKKALEFGFLPKNFSTISISGVVAPFSKISFQYLIPVAASITPFVLKPMQQPLEQ